VLCEAGCILGRLVPAFPASEKLRFLTRPSQVSSQSGQKIHELVSLRQSPWPGAAQSRSAVQCGAVGYSVMQCRIHGAVPSSAV
jgi:hypothetical protein